MFSFPRVSDTDFTAHFCRIENVRGLPEQQRHRSVLALLDPYRVPEKPLRGAVAPTAAFREAVRTFVSRHVTPNVEAWDDAGLVPREVWLEAGRQGFLGLAVAEEHGGGGTDDFRFRVVLIEELNKVAAASLAAGLAVHCDIAIRWATRR